MELNDLIDYCRAQALAHKLHPTEESDYRWFCREYSKTFHTPLLQVLDISPEHVILSVLEEGLDTKYLKKREDFKKIVDELRRLEDPDYDATQNKEFDDFAANIEKWEAQRKAEGRPLPTKSKKENREPALPKKEGFIDLSYLEESENER